MQLSFILWTSTFLFLFGLNHLNNEGYFYYIYNKIFKLLQGATKPYIFSYVDNISNFWWKKIVFQYFIFPWNQKGLEKDKTGNKKYAMYSMS